MIFYMQWFVLAEYGSNQVNDGSTQQEFPVQKPAEQVEQEHLAQTGTAAFYHSHVQKNIYTFNTALKIFCMLHLLTILLAISWPSHH